MGTRRVLSALTARLSVRPPGRYRLAVQASARSAHWCTTCGDYIRPGTHGIHVMSWTGGAREIRDAEPETSDAAAVASVVLVLGGIGLAASVAAWLIYKAQ